jgi:hypothetical protein
MNKRVVMFVIGAMLMTSVGLAVAQAGTMGSGMGSGQMPMGQPPRPEGTSPVNNRVACS